MVSIGIAANRSWKPRLFCRHQRWAEEDIQGCWNLASDISIKYVIKMIVVNCMLCEDNNNKHNAGLQRTDPGTKVKGKFSTRDRIIPHNGQNGFLLFPLFEVGKHTKWIYDKPWLYR